LTDDDDETGSPHSPEQRRSTHEETRHSRETTVRWFGTEFDPVVLVGSLAIIVVGVVLTVGFGDQASVAYRATFAFVNESFGWLYVLAVNVFLVALIAIGLSDYGTIRLGGPDAEPEFSTLGWVAMLFSSGMGVGLLFFGVAEPISHFVSGGGSFFDVPPNTPEAGRAATALTMFHWGLHPWGIYGIVGLALGYFSYNRGLPLSFRSIFYPLVGERIHGWAGRLIDLAAVVATVVGLATATGLAALQITAGVDFLTTTYLGTALATDVWTAATIATALIGVTVVSTWLGLENGIRRLSKLNVVLMVALLVVVLLVGDTVHLFDVFLEGVGTYLGNFLELSLYTEAFAGEAAGWQHAYTIFYWGFWIVWSPFVGLFIARISRGRTIREFVGGVLVVPVLFSLGWMAVFNGSALFVELSVAEGAISGPLQEHGPAVALFEMFSVYPLAFLTAAIATFNLMTFLVTSADSGSLVASYLTTGGTREPTTGQRVLWPLVIGATAIVLLFGNGLRALKTAVIAAGLPFSLVILLMVYSLTVGLRRDTQHDRPGDADRPQRGESDGQDSSRTAEDRSGDE